MAEDRFALIVATNDYKDPEFSKLCAPAQDAEDMARVLADPEIGDFHVTKIVNEPSSHVREEIEQFFLDRRREDTLLLFFSGHGIKDEEGKLFFATANTRRKLLHSTAVPAQFVNEVMNKSRSRQMVILLDCCHAGAFAKGMVVKGDQKIGTAEFLKGQGRVVITASDAMQYAFEGDTVTAVAGEPVRSIFTNSVVQGLQSGEADKNSDGFITVEDLYDYVHDRVTSQMPHQRPEKWAFDVQGDISIARCRVIKPVPLPQSVQELIHNEIPPVRLEGVNRLKGMLQGSNKGLRISALQALQEMRDDDSQRVRSVVSQILATSEVIETASPVSPTEGQVVDKIPLSGTPIRAEEKPTEAQEIPGTFTESFSPVPRETTTLSPETAPVEKPMVKEATEPSGKRPVEGLSSAEATGMTELPEHQGQIVGEIGLPLPETPTDTAEKPPKEEVAPTTLKQRLLGALVGGVAGAGFVLIAFGLTTKEKDFILIFLSVVVPWAIAGAIVCGNKPRVIAMAIAGMVVGFGIVAMISSNPKPGLLLGTPIGAILGALIGRTIAKVKGWT